MVPDLVLVCQITSAILTKDADQNALSIPIAYLLSLVYNPSAKIRVLAFADNLLSVRSSTIDRLARVFRVTAAIPSNTVQ